MKRPPKPPANSFRPAKPVVSQHFDPRMQLGIADIKRLYPGVCAVPKVCRIVESESTHQNGAPFYTNLQTGS
jgi:hypothetical protein